MDEMFVQCEGGHISEVMRPVNTKFCEFDGGDGGGRGIFESEGVAVCLIILQFVAHYQCEVTHTQIKVPCDQSHLICSLPTYM